MGAVRSLELISDMNVTETWGRLQRMTSGSVTTPPGAPRGRPLGFERDALVEALMSAFWEFGWNGASYPRLEQRTGVARSSLGNTIGSKSDLLVAVLERYLVIIDERLLGPLREGTAGLDDVRDFFERLRAGKRTDPGRWGCLMAIAMTERAAEDPAVARLTQDYRSGLTVAFQAALCRAQVHGESRADVGSDLAAALTGIAVGLNVAARGGAGDAELDGIVRGVDRLLDLTRAATD
jgi:AcrR family transcriptional regulator